MSKIVSINEESFDQYDGFIVSLDDSNSIKLGIDNFQSCCENWGYFMTNDSLDDFIGAEVVDVNLVDECLNVEKAPDIYEGGIMFVNIETNRGTLQFVAYNEHNGYYGHEAMFEYKNNRHTEHL